MEQEARFAGAKIPSVKRIAEENLWGAKLGRYIILFSKREGTREYEDIETDAWLV